MNRRVRLNYTSIGLSIVLIIGMAMLGGCDDDTAPPLDNGTGQEGGSNYETGPDPDLPQQQPDSAVDQYLWPDKSVDSFVWPDTYKGTPFGCKTDNDCFGQKCCPTPWGVKLCAPTCAGK